MSSESKRRVPKNNISKPSEEKVGCEIFKEIKRSKDEPHRGHHKEHTPCEYTRFRKRRLQHHLSGVPPIHLQPHQYVDAQSVHPSEMKVKICDSEFTDPTLRANSKPVYSGIPV